MRLSKNWLHKKAPLCKGSWHGEAMTEGLSYEMFRILSYILK